MKHIRRKITLAVLGTMLLVFAALFATVNIFIPRYLTAEAQKAILSEDEHEAPVPFSDIKNEDDEHPAPKAGRWPFTTATRKIGSGRCWRR